jgi:hypothetical protein
VSDEKAKQWAEAAAENRRRFPLTFVELAAWRAVFGPGVRLLYATEGDATLGAPIEARELTVVDATGKRVGIGRAAQLVPASATWRPRDERGN